MKVVGCCTSRAPLALAWPKCAITTLFWWCIPPIKGALLGVVFSGHLGGREHLQCVGGMYSCDALLC